MTEPREPDPAPTERLNPNHIRVLAASFAHIDQQLARVEAALQARPSPLTRELDDFSSEQRRAVLHHIEHIRDRLVSAMRTLELPAPQRIPLSRSLHTTLIAAQTGLDDLAPSRLRGYGLLGP